MIGRYPDRNVPAQIIHRHPWDEALYILPAGRSSEIQGKKIGRQR